MGRMRGVIEEPIGFRYIPSLLTEDEEPELLEHVQDLQFDEVGVSLGSACEMRFQHGQGEGRRVFQQRLDPRSAYVLSGPARNRWQHSIPQVAADRYSLTFRTLRRRPQG